MGGEKAHGQQRRHTVCGSGPLLEGLSPAVAPLKGMLTPALNALYSTGRVQYSYPSPLQFDQPWNQKLEMSTFNLCLLFCECAASFVLAQAISRRGTKMCFA